MSYVMLFPEVAGSCYGPRTVVSKNGQAPTITTLNYEFDGWRGDPILESHPCFIVTENLSATLAEYGFTGFCVAPVLISVSEAYLDVGGPLAAARI